MCCLLQCFSSTELHSWRGVAVGRVKKPLTVMLETLILMLVIDSYLEWQSIIETSEQEICTMTFEDSESREHTENLLM
jgi:hypothetical protein